jgi:hypothetical protein
MPAAAQTSATVQTRTAIRQSFSKIFLIQRLKFDAEAPLSWHVLIKIAPATPFCPETSSFNAHAAYFCAPCMIVRPASPANSM